MFLDNQCVYLYLLQLFVVYFLFSSFVRQRVSLGYNVFNVRCNCSVSPLTEVFSGVTVADCHAAFDVQSCSKFNCSCHLHSIFRLLQCVIYVSKVSGICVVELAADVVSTCQICLGWIPVKKKKPL